MRISPPRSLILSSQMLTSTPNGVFPMIYRLPIDEFSRSDEDGYRVEGGYNEPSQWQLKTKIDSHDCTIQSDNIAFIYTHYFQNQVERTCRSLFSTRLFCFFYI